MKKYILTILLIVPFLLQSQNFRGLDKSPMDQAKFPLSNRVTEKVAVITYSRPQLNNRSFEDIVPLNKVWRTGANEATEIRLYSDIIIDDRNISAGTYTLFTIPEENQVTVIINSATNIWGAYSYKSEKDVIRVKVPLVKSDESLEALSITFSNENDQPKIHFGWEYMRFELPFDVL